LTGLALVLAIGASSALADGTVEMTEGSPTDINSWGFTPPEITISAGQTVTWKNSGSIPHTATATGGQFDTGNVAPGESKAVTLATAGTFAYQCTPHPWMKGTVIVLAAGTQPGAPAAAAPAPAAAPPAAAAPVAQAQATPTPLRLPTPTPFRFTSPGTTTTTTTTATPPRAGGLPVELALPLLAGGASALSGGIYMLRRSRRKD
jgi:plastocyanin